MRSLRTLTRGFSSTLGRFGQGSRSMRTVHEYIVACSIFFSKTFACSVCCTSSKDTSMRAYGSASPLVSHRVGMSCAVRNDCRPRDETDAAATQAPMAGREKTRDRDCITRQRSLVLCAIIHPVHRNPVPYHHHPAHHASPRCLRGHSRCPNTGALMIPHPSPCGGSPRS